MKVYGENVHLLHGNFKYLKTSFSECLTFATNCHFYIIRIISSQSNITHQGQPRITSPIVV